MVNPFTSTLPAVYVPDYSIKANGAPLLPWVSDNIMSVSVDEQFDAPGMFAIVVNDPDLAFINNTRGTFTEGTEISISMGYVGELKKLITGEIASLEPSFPNDGPATLTVRGYDYLHRMSQGTFSRSFTDVTYGSLIRQLAQEVKLKAQPAPALLSKKVIYAAQKNKSNLDFLKGQLGILGYDFWADGQTLHVGERKAPLMALPLQLQWRKTLLSFQPRLSLANQVEEVVVRGWDIEKSNTFKGTAKLPATVAKKLSSAGWKDLKQGSGGKSQFDLFKYPISSDSEAKAIAKNKLAEMINDMITGDGTSVGNPDIRVAHSLKLTDIGRFSDTYQITKASHQLGENGYQTSFSVRKHLL